MTEFTQMIHVIDSVISQNTTHNHVNRAVFDDKLCDTKSQISQW